MRRELEELETALITSDLGVQTTTEIIDALRERARRQAIEGGEELRELLKSRLETILEGPQKPVVEPASPPQVTFLVGVNGTGKTTTSGKLAAWSRAQDRTVLLCAADTFRAAAIEQLEVWASALGRGDGEDEPGRRSGGGAVRRVSAAKARKLGALCGYSGTAAHQDGTDGRTRQDAPDGSRLIPDAPHEVLLVMDATTGQNGLQQARLFTQSAGVTGIVLTKLDGTAKGGIAVAIARELNLPVRFVGVGEKMTDLLEFSPEAFVDGLLG